MLPGILSCVMIILMTDLVVTQNYRREDSGSRKTIDDKIEELTRAVEKLYLLMNRRDAVLENRMTALDEAIAEVTRELKYGTPHAIAKPCPTSWRNYAGMCLRFVKEAESWDYANYYCQQKDGFLVWIANKKEHNIVREFAKMHGHQEWFWIGLFRHKNGTFDWSSGMYSRYRGFPFTNVGDKVFAADARDTQIDGVSDVTRRYSYICRYVAASKNSSTTSLLQMSAIQTMNEMERIAVENEDRLFNVTKCPLPWKKYNDMCLLYIYQKRTWRDAQDMCTTLGGNLAWFNDYKEHNVVQYPNGAFVPNRAVHDWFWIGLQWFYDNYYGWIAHSDSEYKGDSFVNATEPYFAATRKSRQFKGFGENEELSSLCRRTVI